MKFCIKTCQSTPALITILPNSYSYTCTCIAFEHIDSLAKFAESYIITPQEYSYIATT